MQDFEDDEYSRDDGELVVIGCNVVLFQFILVVVVKFDEIPDL
jgi:hypothetical protein